MISYHENLVHSLALLYLSPNKLEISPFAHNKAVLPYRLHKAWYPGATQLTITPLVEVGDVRIVILIDSDSGRIHPPINTFVV